MLLLTENEETQATQPKPRSKIMIVDDDPAICLALTVRLRVNHYKTVSARDGHSALALAQEERPNLILLDLGLPREDGFAVLKWLQQVPALVEIPVIILSGQNPQAHAKRVLESGAVAFFQKPADNKELFGMIRDCLQFGSGGRFRPTRQD
jgi:DNA-binding response OmpR family regulator